MYIILPRSMIKHSKIKKILFDLDWNLGAELRGRRAIVLLQFSRYYCKVPIRLLKRSCELVFYHKIKIKTKRAMVTEFRGKGLKWLFITIIYLKYIMCTSIEILALSFVFLTYISFWTLEDNLRLRPRAGEIEYHYSAHL